MEILGDGAMKTKPEAEVMTPQAKKRLEGP